MSRLFPLVVSLGFVVACAFDRGGLPADEAPPDAVELTPPPADAGLPPDARPPQPPPPEPPPPPQPPDARVADPDPAPGDTGAPCQDDDECSSGRCEDFGDTLGERCALTCRGQGNCPANYECRSDVCVPD
jgi:hypothetical protein